MEDRKIMGITMDDPASIGPEITAKVLANQFMCEICRLIVVEDVYVLEAALKIADHEEMRVQVVGDVRDAIFIHGTIDVLDIGLVSMDELVRGQMSAIRGDAAFRHMEKVIELTMDGQMDTTVTNVFNKKAVNLTGHHYSGHTEIYADLTGVKNYTMMLTYESMWVVHVSAHASLREACDRVKKQWVLDTIRIGDKTRGEMGTGNPRIAVAGLNPHSGGHGPFGQGEIQGVIPVVEVARAEGIQTKGPVPSDTTFSKTRGGRYDTAVAMYHDQGRILPKVAGFAYDQEKQAWGVVTGVNIVLGLPIICASVGHGTASDQVGTGTAGGLSLKNSPEYIVMFARNWKQESI